MKIGIITPYDSSNIGAFMQAYAMQTFLESENYEVYFIKIRNKKELKKIFYGSIKNIKSFFSRYFFNRNKYNIFQKTVKETFKTINIEDVNSKNIDAIIIGSDEVWNVKKEFYRKKCFYGIDIDVDKKIAYAPSCGMAKIEDYANYEYIKQGMKNLDSILPRDVQTQNIVEDLIGKKCPIVMDPTLLANFREKDITKEIKNKYVLVYGYSFNKKQIEYIKKIAKENDCKTISVCIKHLWCDKNINCSPLEFSEIIKKAEFVITKTFHGTIFSILNKKKFITFVGSQKIMDLLKRISLSDRLVDEEKYGYEEFKYKLKSMPDFDNSFQIIEEERKESIKLLKEVLEK